MSRLINLFTVCIFLIIINYTVSKADGYCEGGCYEEGCYNRITIDTNSSTTYFCRIPCVENEYKSCEKNITCDTTVRTTVTEYHNIKTDSTEEMIFKRTDLDGENPQIEKIVRKYDKGISTQKNKSDNTGKVITEWTGLNEKTVIKEMIWKNEKLVRITDSNISREIIHFEDPCSFAIVEPSGKTINFKFDDKKSLKDLRKQYSSIVTSKIILDKKKEIDTSFVYSWIIDEKYKECKKE